MRILAKKTFRDLLQLNWRAAGIALIMAIGVCFYAGGFMARDSIYNTRDSYYDELNLAHLDIYFDALEEHELPAFDIAGLTFTKRFCRKTSIDMNGREPSALIVIHQHETGPRTINNLEIVEGGWLQPEDHEGILLEKGFAEAHGFKVGDRIALRSVIAPQEVIIRGIVISPEYMIPMGNNYQFVPVKGALGVAFATFDYLIDIFGYPMYNNFCFFYQDENNASALKRQIMEAMSGLKIKRLTKRTEQFSYKFLQQQLKSFRIFIPAVVFLIGVVACTVTAMTFNRLIQSQRRELGVFMAMGYSSQSLFFAFLVLACVLGVIGGILGTACSPFMCRLIGATYGRYIGLPEVRFVYPIEYGIQGIMIGIFVTFLSCALPLLAVFRITPKDAIRSTPSERNLTSLLKIVAKLDYGSLTLKYSIRNLLRQPGLSFVIVALIALSIGICTAFFASSESWDYHAEKALAQEKWDIVATFRVPLTWEEAKMSWNRKELSDIRPMLGAAVEIKNPDFSRDFMLTAVPDFRRVMDLEFAHGGYFSSDDAYEIIFTAIDSVPVKVGDTVMVTMDGHHYSFKVVGILKRMTTQIVYIPMKTARKMLLDKPVGFFAYSSLPGKTIRDQIYASDENVAWVQPKSDIRKAVFEFLGNARILTIIGLWVSLFLSILFLLTGITINIREREAEYATFASLGFSTRFIIGIVIVETVIEGLLGVMLSLPLSYGFSSFLNYEMSKAWFEVDLYLTPRDVAMVICYAIAFLPIAAIPGIKHLAKMDVAATVRFRNFG